MTTGSEMNMKTVLITGASAGFGKRVTEKLLAAGYTVYAAKLPATASSRD